MSLPIHNAHLHTFTSRHVPSHFKTWPLMPIIRSKFGGWLAKKIFPKLKGDAGERLPQAGSVRRVLSVASGRREQRVGSKKSMDDDGSRRESHCDPHARPIEKTVVCQRSELD